MMLKKTNIAFLIVSLIFISGCGDSLSDYQSEIIKKAELIISSNNEDELSSREVKILLTVLYIECVKLKEHNNEGAAYDKLFTAFTRLLPTYQDLQSLEIKKLENMEIDTAIKAAEAMIADSKDRRIELVDELELELQNLENYRNELSSDAQELYASLLRITTETQESSIWAKAKARDYTQKFYSLIDPDIDPE